MRFLPEKEKEEGLPSVFSSHKERCVNCKFLDARLICGLGLIKLPRGASEFKVQIIDPENQVCDNFIDR